MTVADALPPDPVLHAGKLFFNCPTCTEMISVAQEQIDPVVGVNATCPACRNILHLPGSFQAETVPPGYMITAGVRIPIEGFIDWYFENPFINRLIQTGQAEMQNEYGLWGFCSACHHQFPASVLTSLVNGPVMPQRKVDSLLSIAGRADSGKDMQALRSGRCPECEHKEMIVIATLIPDNVRRAALKIEKYTACVTASNAPGLKAEVRKAKGRKGILAILAAGCTLALLVWAMFNRSDLALLVAPKTQTAQPRSTFPALPVGSTSPSPPQPVQAGGICWTHKVKDFYGTRSQAWEKVVDDQTRNLLHYDKFLVDVVLHNPQLKDDGYVFLDEKIYLLPELCP